MFAKKSDALWDDRSFFSCGGRKNSLFRVKNKNEMIFMIKTCIKIYRCVFVFCSWQISSSEIERILTNRRLGCPVERKKNLFILFLESNRLLRGFNLRTFNNWLISLIRSSRIWLCILGSTILKICRPNLFISEFARFPIVPPPKRPSNFAWNEPIERAKSMDFTCMCLSWSFIVVRILTDIADGWMLYGPEPLTGTNWSALPFRL